MSDKHEEIEAVPEVAEGTDQKWDVIDHDDWVYEIRFYPHRRFRKYALIACRHWVGRFWRLKSAERRVDALKTKYLDQKSPLWFRTVETCCDRNR